ncbi:hypothetical protein [Enterococcus sp. LJL51]|uniref:hypothetical protein n=1 Tax=Enterococcus sp. LJL51 TaxID=3416656 RepID=UPI003CF9158C
MRAKAGKSGDRDDASLIPVSGEKAAGLKTACLVKLLRFLSAGSKSLDRTE